MPDQAWNDGYYGNAQGRGSFHYYGKGYFSPEYQRWSAGQQQRASDEAAAARSSSTSATATPIFGGAATSTFSGGGGIGPIGAISGGGSVVVGHGLVGGSIRLLFFLSALFGTYNGFANHTSILESAGKTAGTVYGFSDLLGNKIRHIDPDSSIITVVNGVRWVIGAGAAIDAGLGAGAGNTVASVIRGGVHLIKTAQTNSTHGATVSESAAAYTPSTPTSYATITAINLNLRSDPRIDPDNILTTMPQGLHVRVVGHADNGWLELDGVPGAGDQSERRFHGFASPKGLTEN